MAKKKTVSKSRSTASASTNGRRATKKTASKKTTSKKKTAKKTPARKAAATRKKAATKKKTAKKTKRSTAVTASGGNSKKTSKKKSSTRQKVKPGASGQSSAASGPTRRKTHLSDKELAHFKKLLLAKASEILGDIVSMSEEALNIDAANLSHMPIHMADVGSDIYDQELTLGLVESERRLVHEIFEALERIKDRTYGVCEATGKPINKARLNAKPWAKYCIEAAREMERNGRL